MNEINEIIDKEKMKDTRERARTQSLFLELGYTDFAMYTLKDEDYFYKGELYPSLKRLYLSMEDVVEYDFANKYLLGWSHWQRMCENKQIKAHINEWRTELELKLRSRGVKEMMNKADTSPMAAKWLADKGWVTKKDAKEELNASGKVKIQEQIDNDFGADIARIGL
jgi:hypothetical protein